MNRGGVLKWLALMLVGPAAGVTGVVLYERGIEEGGSLAGIGWITAAIVSSWLAVKIFHALPVRYCVWAMIGAIPLAVVSVLLHAAVFALTGSEDPFFFILAIFGAPLLFIGGLIGALLPRQRGVREGGALTPHAR